MGAFEWGAMTELRRLGIDYSFFDYYVTTSAGAFNACFFLGEQFDEGKRIWLEHLPSGFWKPLHNDMRYLRKILTETEPLKCELITSRKQKIFVALSNLNTQQAEYKELNDPNRLIDVLLAGSSIPFLAPPFSLAGQLYYDGGLVAQPPIKKALELQPTELWLISPKPVGYRENKFLWQILSLFFIFDSNSRKLLYNYPIEENNALELSEKVRNIKVIRPMNTLPIGFRSKNKQLIQKVYQTGVEMARGASEK